MFHSNISCISFLLSYRIGNPFFCFGQYRNIIGLKVFLNPPPHTNSTRNLLPTSAALRRSVSTDGDSSPPLRPAMADCVAPIRSARTTYSSPACHRSLAPFDEWLNPQGGVHPATYTSPPPKTPPIPNATPCYPRPNPVKNRLTSPLYTQQIQPLPPLSRALRTPATHKVDLPPLPSDRGPSHPEPALTRILDHAHIPELPNPNFGKVRDCYDLPATHDHGPRRILISSDRISAFDRILAAIPFKGQVLTQVARFWFDRTGDICPNHVISYPDPNVVIGQRLDILPVEIVVRGYLAGTTGTSILTQYKAGQRAMYGHVFPDGLRDNQALPAAIITPTTKAFDGGHDEPLTADDIIKTGLLTPAQWDEVAAISLALFARGQNMASERGLILCDTKYEFGTDATGRILIADEMHTPDSSRYWIADGYEAAFNAGTRPPSFDKDVIRAWVAARCDPYKDPVPEIPADMIAATSATYIAAYEAITGQNFVPDISGDTPLARIRSNLAAYFTA